MAEPFRILGIAGSLRKASFNRGLIRAAQALVPEGVIIEPIEIDAMPHYNADIDAAGHPPSVEEFKNRVLGADALLIATPEYNNSIPGALKNAIDWASRPFGNGALKGKPVAVMGASAGPGATKRVQPTLKVVLAAANCRVLPEPEVFVAGAFMHCDPEGNLKDDSAIRDEIRGLIAALVEFSRQPTD